MKGYFPIETLVTISKIKNRAIQGAHNSVMYTAPILKKK